MAASEHQPEALVRNIADIGAWLVGLSDGSGSYLRFDDFLKMGLAADAVDGFVACGLNDPGARRIWYACRPLLHRRRKGFLRRFFGQVKVTRELDERRDDPAPIGAIDFVNSIVEIQGHAEILDIFLPG